MAACHDQPSFITGHPNLISDTLGNSNIIQTHSLFATSLGCQGRVSCFKQYEAVDYCDINYMIKQSFPPSEKSKPNMYNSTNNNRDGVFSPYITL